MADAKTGPDAEPDTPVRFDEVLGQLEAIVQQLEQADLPLETSLDAFERGVALSRQGQKILDAAERRVELLLRDGTTEPYSAASDPAE